MSIFRTYPASEFPSRCVNEFDEENVIGLVREKYEQNVHAGHMNEADFWRTFFQSHYFTMDRMQTSNSRDLFADCVRRDDESK